MFFFFFLFLTSFPRFDAAPTVRPSQPFVERESDPLNAVQDKPRPVVLPQPTCSGTGKIRECF